MALSQVSPIPTNPILDVLNAHRSERDFSETPVGEDVIEAIVCAGQHTPSSINGQQISVIVVRDPETRARIAENTGGQTWIATVPVLFILVMDYHKTGIGVAMHGETQRIQSSAEGLIVAATDAGIVLSSMLTAAQSLGLGGVPLGSIRANPQALIELLGLPENTFPVVALGIGYPRVSAAQKPRLPLATFYHRERYSPEGYAEAIAQYDATLMEHWNATGRKDGTSWSSSVASAYRQNYRPTLAAVLKRQGFGFD